MSDWSKDIDLEVIKEYLRECAENDDYHYEQYQIDIIMHEYIRQNQEIERLNNIIKEAREYIETLNEYGIGKNAKKELLEILGSEKE